LLSENPSCPPFSTGRNLPLFGKEGRGEILRKCDLIIKPLVSIITFFQGEKNKKGEQSSETSALPVYFR
jgi:hypothetical protein